MRLRVWRAHRAWIPKHVGNLLENTGYGGGGG